MRNSDDYDMTDEDIFTLEDNNGLESTALIVPVGEDMEPLAPDTPIYRLRLLYSHETFPAAYPLEKLEKKEILNPKTMVLVPTRYGRDLAQVIGLIPKTTPQLLSEITRIERCATQEDLEKSARHKVQEKEAFEICREKAAFHNLEMKLVSVHYLLEDPKILFFFTADNRVDFRELVKDLVSVFKTRIELRQIGVRDESRDLGGLGVCGRGYCCHTVSDKLKPVSIKMAKDQNLSLNSMKISGPCGRLLCCLAYEHCFYHEQRRLIPPEGCRITYDGTVWKVLEVNVVLGKAKLVAEDGRQIQIAAAAFERAEGRWRIVLRT